MSEHENERYPNSERKAPSPDAPQLGETAPSASDTATEPNPHPSGNAARPENQEPLGVGAEMFKGVAAETAAYVSGEDEEALREAMNLGVEHEGIEAAQLVGLIAATLIAIAVLVVTVFYVLISPTVQGAQAVAEQEELYPELASTRAAGLALVSDYAVVSAEEGTYRIPISDAERLVSRRYALLQEGAGDLVLPPDHYALGGVTTEPAGSVVASVSGRNVSRTPLPDRAAQSTPPETP